jgi:hypothetical protein
VARAFADEVDLQAGDRVEEAVGERGSSQMEATIWLMDQDHVGDAALPHDLLQPASSAWSLQ